MDVERHVNNCVNIDVPLHPACLKHAAVCTLDAGHTTRTV